jgi:hypothetical protein
VRACVRATACRGVRAHAHCQAEFQVACAAVYVRGPGKRVRVTVLGPGPARRPGRVPDSDSESPELEVTMTPLLPGC